MSMTAYMALLAANQPWNLILFMVIPVACAETLVASEFFVLYGKATHGDAAQSTFAEKLTKYLGFFLAIYYACISSSQSYRELSGRVRLTSSRSRSSSSPLFRRF